MKRRDIVRRAMRNLRRAKGRTVLTALAISVGALTIALAMAAGEGGRRYTENLVSGSGDREMIIVAPKHPDGGKEELPEYNTEHDTTKQSDIAVDKRVLTDEDLAGIRRLPHVARVVPAYSTDSVQYVQSGANGKKIMAPVKVKHDKTRVELAAGSLEQQMPAPGQAVMAEDFLAQFGFADAASAIGQTITLHVQSVGAAKDIPLTIAAVDKKSDTLVYYKPAVRISSADARTVYEVGRPSDAPHEYHSVNVFADDASHVAVLQDELKKHYEAFSLQDMRSTLLTMVSTAQYGLMGFGALALLASVFGIINTMYISVLERTQQIGLMKALGASGRDIGRLFRYEAAWVGLLGGVIGVAGAMVVTLFNPMIAQFLELEAGTQLLVLTPLPIALLLAGLVCLAVLSGWLPSRRAAKLDPIEALRTE